MNMLYSQGRSQRKGIGGHHEFTARGYECKNRGAEWGCDVGADLPFPTGEGLIGRNASPQKTILI